VYRKKNKRVLKKILKNINKNYEITTIKTRNAKNAERLFTEILIAFT
jgi:hypothetical protein